MLATLVLNKAILGLDQLCSRAQLRLFERTGSLITILLHNLFLDDEESRRDLCYPQQRTTIDHLRRCIQYFQGCGYRFVSPQEVIDGLDPAGKHVLLSFDDGYYNNRRALPLMEQYNVPGLFFIAAGLVKEGSAYWWDVLYRHQRRQGRSAPEICINVAGRIARRTSEIEEEVRQETGVSALKPIADLDRVFNPVELREFAAHPKVWIGNHSWMHTYLPIYPIKEARADIIRAQETLREFTGKTPLAISYPYGAWTPELAEAAVQAGIPLGFITATGKERISSTTDSRRRMRLGRFGLYCETGIEAQCRFMRSDLMWHARYERLLGRIKLLIGKKRWYGG